MKKFALLLVMVITYFLGVNAFSINADFHWEPTMPTDMEYAHFYDDSQGEIIAWIWYFGDGNTSNTQNPVHKYRDNGIYTVRLVIWDKYGNIDYVEKQITVTNVPPVANAGKSPRFENTLNVSFNASMSYDPDGGIISYEWDFGDGNQGYGQNIRHVYNEAGVYIVNLTVTDNDGDSSKDSIFLLIDINPPITNYSLDVVKQWYTGAVNVSLEASDDLSGVNATFYKINDENWIKYEESFKVDKEGINKVSFYSTDKAGNKENVKEIEIKIDRSPPFTKCEINATYGKNNWIISSAKIKLKANDNFSGVNYTMYRVDDGEWKKYQGEINISSNGEHIIRFYSVDIVGNIENEKNVTFKIDREKPDVSIDSPMEGYVYIADRRLVPTMFGNTFIIGKATARAEAHDIHSKIDHVVFMLNGVILWDDYAYPFEAELPQEFPWERNVLKVIAYDKAGNHAESEEIRYIKIL